MELKENCLCGEKLVLNREQTEHQGNIFKNVPVEICPECNEKFYSSDTIKMIETLIQAKEAGITLVDQDNFVSKRVKDAAELAQDKLTEKGLDDFNLGFYKGQLLLANDLTTIMKEYIPVT